jgi:Fe2+ or Zn2+ uptake regulation protein
MEARRTLDDVIHRLRGMGVVLTHQRLAVIRYLNEHCHSHPTATEIYRQLRKTYPTISQATVYSTLDLLRKAGQVRELSIRGDQACYDAGGTPHYHLFCRTCQRVLDISSPCPSLEEGLPEGHRVEDVQLYLYGTCRDSLKDAADGQPAAVNPAGGGPAGRRT